MAKQQPKMRWRKRDSAEIQRIINNFNNKLYRTKKAKPELIEYLPVRLKKSDVIESIETRADFNRVIESIKRFSVRGAEKPVHSSRGLKTTVWQVNEFKRMEFEENKRRAKERKKIGKKSATVGGRETGETASKAGTIKDSALKPSNKNPLNMTQKEFEYAWNNLEANLNASIRKQGMEKMRENYIKGLRDANILDAEPEIEKFIRGLSIDDFFNITQTDFYADFMFYKDPIEFERRVSQIHNTWLQPYSEKLRESTLSEMQGKRKYSKAFKDWVKGVTYQEFYYTFEEKTVDQLFDYWKTEIKGV